jgi:carboxylate-amine ligase
MDIQECPPADLAIQALVIETIKSLVDESFCNLEEQMRVRTEIMAGILDDTAHQGQQAEILSSEFPNIFGLRSPCTAGDLWKHIYARLQAKDASLAHWDKELAVILNEGTLADRILHYLHGDFSTASLHQVYRRLSDCLAQNKMLLL